MKAFARTCLAACLPLLAACSPGTDQPAKESSKQPENRELLNTMQPSLDKARGVEQTLQKEDDARRKQMDEQ